MGGASPARPAGAGLAAMSFTAWAVRPAVFCRTSIAMALSLRRWSMSRSWAVMASEVEVVAVEEARRVEVAVEMVEVA
eukprot:1892085-Lingulodinium_polyedra.AAC.1